MIISGLEIKNMLNKEIFIEPFDDSRLNPNSYNLRLHNELLVYDSHVLDMKVKNETKTISIPPEGLVLEPGIVYLGRTVEYTKTLNHVPMLEGRSDVWEYIYMSPPVSEMWVFRVIGLWKYLVFNRYGYIRTSKYVKYFIIRF